MNPTIVIESGTDDRSEPPREVLCSVWPLSHAGDQLAIGEPLFTNHMVSIWNSASDISNSTLRLPEAGAYLVDVGYPNGHSLRTTISVDEDQSYRLIVEGPVQISYGSEKSKSTYSFVPRVISAANKRFAVRKKELEVSVLTQQHKASLSGLYELAYNAGRHNNFGELIFDRAKSTDLIHEVTLEGHREAFGPQLTAERKWLVIRSKEKSQFLIAYPSNWTSDTSAPFKLMIGRNSITDKWSASLKLTDSVYGSLVEYLTRRDLSSAHSIAESDRGKATTALYMKANNPFSAAAAAYFFALGGATDKKHHQWMESLSSTYQWLPDGAIALGWKTLREDSQSPDTREKARRLFTEAWQRGLPYYTVGLHILVDALTLLSKLYKNDLALQEMLAAAKAADVACVRTEPFTTLQISRYLGLPRASECSN